MKKILFLLFAMLAVANVPAQESGNITLVDGKTWKFVDIYRTTMDIHHSATVVGDTLINNLKFKKILCDNGVYKHIVCLYEKDNRIYAYIKGKDGKQELKKVIDFNLKKGDRVFPDEPEDSFLGGIKVGYVSTCYHEEYGQGPAYKYLELFTADGARWSRWVEGIGTSYGYNMLYPANPPEEFDGYTKFVSCQDKDGKLLFRNLDFFWDIPVGAK